MNCNYSHSIPRLWYKDNFIDNDISFNQWDDLSGDFRSWYIQTSSTGLSFVLSSDVTNQPGNEITYLTTINTDTWYHVVATKTGENATLYLNGVLVSTGSVNSELYNYSDVIRVGRYFWAAADRNTDIRVDEVSFYNRAITYDEVDNIYNSGDIYEN